MHEGMKIHMMFHLRGRKANHGFLQIGKVGQGTERVERECFQPVQVAQDAVCHKYQHFLFVKGTNNTLQHVLLVKWKSQ